MTGRRYAAEQLAVACATSFAGGCVAAALLVLATAEAVDRAVRLPQSSGRGPSGEGATPARHLQAVRP